MSHELFIYPTDTVWGIGGRAFESVTYAEIAKVKQTDVHKPLSILFSSLEQMKDYLDVPEALEQVISETYHLEATFGVDKKYFKEVLPEVPFGSTSFACFRIINNELIREIIETAGGPITTTSLNITGNPAITDELDAKDFWKKYISSASFYSMDHGSDLTGHSSTIIIFSGNDYKVLREGNRINDIKESLRKYSFHLKE